MGTERSVAFVQTARQLQPTEEFAEDGERDLLRMRSRDSRERKYIAAEKYDFFCTSVNDEQTWNENEGLILLVIYY